MKDVLVIKTDCILSEEAQRRLCEKFKQEINNKVVIIPAYLEAELIHVPDNVEVRIESADVPPDFQIKRMNIKLRKEKGE